MRLGSGIHKVADLNAWGGTLVVALVNALGLGPIQVHSVHTQTIAAKLHVRLAELHMIR